MNPKFSRESMKHVRIRLQDTLIPDALFYHGKGQFMIHDPLILNCFFSDTICMCFYFVSSIRVPEDTKVYICTRCKFVNITEFT